VARDLKDSQAQDVSDDWRFAIAYNAALQAATAALAAAGYRTSRDNHHYRVIQSLELTLGKDTKFVRALDAFRKKTQRQQLRHRWWDLASRGRGKCLGLRRPCSKMSSIGYEQTTPHFSNEMMFSPFHFSRWLI
jgi:hypothetical protein